jgi:hypothetical protein
MLEKDIAPKKPKAIPHRSSAQKKKSLRSKK